MSEGKKIYYPCSECKRKQYTEECDEICDYAMAVRERDRLEAVVEKFENKFDFETLIKEAIDNIETIIVKDEEDLL